MVLKLELDLKPDVEAGLAAEVQARGLSLEAYLEQVIQDHAISVPVLSGEAWKREFDAWVNSFSDTPVLSDEAISRDSLYPDRW